VDLVKVGQLEVPSLYRLDWCNEVIRRRGLRLEKGSCGAFGAKSALKSFGWVHEAGPKVLSGGREVLLTASLDDLSVLSVCFQAL
jgi:hypothetical protein